MWAPSDVNHFDIATHVFTVEFHTYFYHLLDVLPIFAPLPCLSGRSKGFEALELEEIDVQVRTREGEFKFEHIKFPKRFGAVLDYYLLDTTPIFFPSYEYHTLSPQGVVLRHVVLQTNRKGEMFTKLIPALMLNVELDGLERVEWRTSGGMVAYRADLLEILAPPQPVAGKVPQACASAGGTSTPKPKVVRSASGVDLRPVAPTVLNQGDLGTCGVSAVTSFLEFVTGERLSVLFLYWTARVELGNAAPHDDAGVELRDALRALEQFGLCRDAPWPYDVTRFSQRPPEAAFREAARFRPRVGHEIAELETLEQMRECLAVRELPFFADVFFAPESYGQETTRTGLVPPPPKHTWDDSCEHTCLVVGYDDARELLIFQNSWGTDWGDRGFGYLPYEYIKRKLFRNAFTWIAPRLDRSPFVDDLAGS